MKSNYKLYKEINFILDILILAFITSKFIQIHIFSKNSNNLHPSPDSVVINFLHHAVRLL